MCGSEEGCCALTTRLLLAMRLSSVRLMILRASWQRRCRGTISRNSGMFQYGSGYVLRYSASLSTVYTACMVSEGMKPFV